MPLNGSSRGRHTRATIMLGFLKIVAGTCLGILLVVFLVGFWVRGKLRKIVTTIKEALADSVPPFRIKLKPCPAGDWEHSDQRDARHAELCELGFEPIGDFSVEPTGVTMRAYVHPHRVTYATVYEHPAVGVWCDLYRSYQDESSFTYSTTASPQMDSPPYKTVQQFQDAALAEVAEQLWRDSPERGMTVVAPEDFPKFFEAAYAREMNWQMTRGGPTEEEIRRVAEAEGTECTPQQMRAIQSQWRYRISTFISQRQLARFRKQSAMTPAEYEALSDRLIAVHDRMPPELVLGVVDDEYIVDFDSEQEDADSQEDGQSSPQKIDQVRAWCRESSPRQAFRSLLDDLSAADRFELLGTVDRPAAGDIWLKSDDEDDEEQELEEYDEFLDD